MSFIGALGCNTFDKEIDEVIINTSDHILITSNIISNHILDTNNYIFDTSNMISNHMCDTSNVTSDYFLDTSYVISNHILDTSNYTARIEEELSDRIGYQASLYPFELPTGVYFPLKTQELEIAEVGRVVGLHTSAILGIEEQVLALVGSGEIIGVITGGAVGGATTTANNANSKANTANTQVDHVIISTTADKADTSNFIIDTSNIITTRIDNLNSGSVPTVANVFPLLYNSHFEQTSDGLSPNKISIKNISLSGGFDYNFLKVPPIVPTNTIVPIVEPTSSPSVSKITINSEYKYMAFTYTTGATNTPYTITFNEETECDILIVAGGGSGGGGAGTDTGVGGGGGGQVRLKI